jgi:ribonuclease P protein component
VPGRFVVLSILADSESVTRFGFVVSKKIGNAPARNLVRRRLKAIAFEALGQLPAGRAIVMRALPGAAQASWADLNADVQRSLSKANT